jgi:hypothetical protein
LARIISESSDYLFKFRDLFLLNRNDSILAIATCLRGPEPPTAGPGGTASGAFGAASEAHAGSRRMVAAQKYFPAHRRQRSQSSLEAARTPDKESHDARNSAPSRYSVTVSRTRHLTV